MPDSVLHKPDIFQAAHLSARASSDQRLTAGIVGCGIFFWATLYAFIAPQSLGTDFFPFKDTAINFAQGRGLVAVSTIDNPTLDYLYYSNYPPLFPILYGLYAWAVGIGAYQNTYFSLLIQSLNALLIWRVLIAGALRTAATSLKVTAALLVVILIPATINYDRPEELSLCLFLLSAAAFDRLTRTASFSTATAAAAGLAGVNVMVSPFCGTVAALGLWCLIAGRALPVSPRHPSLVQLTAVFILCAAVAPSLVAVATGLIDAEAFPRFWRHVQAQQSARLSVAVWLQTAVSTGTLGLIGLSSFAFCFFMTVSASMYEAFHRRFYAAALVGGLALTMLVLLLLAQKVYYVYFSCWILLAVYAGVCTERGQIRLHHACTVGLLAGLMLIYSPRLTRELYARATSAEAYRQAEREVDALAAELEPDSFAAVSQQYYFFIKPRHFRVCDTHISLFTHADTRIRYVVVGGETYLTDSAAAHSSASMLVPSIPQWTKNEPFVLRRTPTDVRVPQTAFERLMLRPSDLWSPFLFERVKSASPSLHPQSVFPNTEIPATDAPGLPL